ncbi:putative Linear gramicidin synthase subunit C [Streptomyces afghaniensis 772] [Streptomyces afghaniensis]
MELTHRGVVDLCEWQHRRFAFTPADRSAVVCSQSFDASILEIWPALTAGASVTIAGEDLRRDPLALARWYTEQGVTFSILPTALGEQVLRLPPTDQPPLRHLLLGGDVLRTRPRPEAPYETVNVYGPTEVTVLCTTETVSPQDTAARQDPARPIALGRPVDNVTLSVLDAAGSPVPVGAVGELYVSGPGVALGYLHRPELTEERFLPDPDGGPDARRYRTGDLVRWNGDGRLEFCGRADDQVKIRGFRVEPEEVSRVLNALDGVREAAVLARRNDRGEAYLAAYAVPADPIGAAADDRQALADLLAEELAARLRSTWCRVPGGSRPPCHRRPTASWTAPRCRRPTSSPRHRAAGPAAPAGRSRRPATARTSNNGCDACGPPSSASTPAPSRPTPRSSTWAATRSPRCGWSTGPGGVRHRVPDAGLLPGADAAGHDDPPGRNARASNAEPGGRGRRRPRHGGAQGTRHHPAVPLRPRSPAEHPLPQVFNVALRITLSGSLDIAALRTALTRLVERHEGLRTRLARSGNGWEQQVLRPGPVQMPLEDLTARPAHERQAALDRASTQAAETPIDPTHAHRCPCACCAPASAPGCCSSSCTTPPATDGPSACC